MGDGAVGSFVQRQISLRLGHRGARPEYPERARVTVEERPPPDRADLAVTEEARERHIAEMAMKRVGVVIALSVEVHSAV